ATFRRAHRLTATLRRAHGSAALGGLGGGSGGGLGRGRAVAVEDASGLALLDRGRGRLHLQAGGLQLLQDLLAGKPTFLRDLMNALLRHAVSPSLRSPRGFPPDL